MDLKVAVLLIACAQFCTAMPASESCVCARKYTPICGSNGITYNNQCLFDCQTRYEGYQITVAKYGPCEENKTGICGCSLEYIPVCGNDGRTYPNTCHVSCKSFTNPSLDVAYQGECQYNFPHERQ